VGSLTLPALASAIYLDTNSIIYSVEHIPPYHDLLLPIWQSAKNNTHRIVTSGLSLLETLVGPLKSGDTQLEADYRTLLQGASDVKLSPISEAVLEQAAQLRATTALKTPDAIHAATALVEGCALLVTNDPIFRRVPGLTVVVLGDLITP
jgi:predicted nucleic acid-binding protein